MQNRSTQAKDTITATEHILSHRNYPRRPAFLLAALEDVAVQFGGIPPESKPVILEYFGVEKLPDGIEETLLRKRAPDERAITVCAGPICVRQGSDNLAAELSAHTGVSIERQHCMGHCDSAPCVKVADNTITSATSAKVLAILA